MSKVRYFIALLHDDNTVNIVQSGTKQKERIKSLKKDNDRVFKVSGINVDDALNNLKNELSLDLTLTKIERKNSTTTFSEIEL